MSWTTKVYDRATSYKDALRAVYYFGVNDNHPRVGVGGILLDGPRVLLQLRKKPPEAGFWSLPGGRVEYMELVEHALVREFLEELGVHIEVEALVCVTNHIVPADTAHWVSPVYRVRLISGTPQNLEPEKTAALEWFPLSSLPENLSTAARSALTAYRQIPEHA